MRLFVVIIISSLGGQHPAILTSLAVLLVVDGELAKVADNVLHLAVVHVTVLATEIVEPSDLVEEEVDNGDDDGDTNGVAPDDDDSDNVGPSVTALVEVVGRVGGNRVARQPSEDTEESGQSVDGEDRENQLEGREGLTTTSDENEPVLSKGNFEEKDFLNGTKVLNDTTGWQEHASSDNPSTDGEKYTEDDRDEPDLGQLPLDRTLLRVSIVVGDGDGGQISEEGDKDNQVTSDDFVDDNGREGEVDFQVQAESDTVLDVCLHTLENLASSLDGQDDGGKTGGKEDDVGGSLGSFGGTFNSNTTISLLEGRSIVDTVTSHGSQMATLLQHLDDLVLVFGEDFSETIGTLDKVVLSRAGKTTVDKLRRVVDLGTKSEHLASLLGNSDSITSQHLDRDTEVLGFDDGLRGVVTRRVEHRKHTEENPWLLVLAVGDTKRSETTASELGSLGAEEGGLLLTGGSKSQNSLRGTLCAFVAVTAKSANGNNTLGDRIERSEFLGLPVVLENIAGLGVTLESEDGDLVNGIEGLDVVRRSQSCDSHHPVDVLAFGDERLTNGKLVSGEGTGLVRTQNVDTCERLDGSQLLDNSLLLGEIGGTDGESGGGDDGKTDGDTDDKHDKSNGQKRLRRFFWGGNAHVAEETTDPGGENPEDDENQKRCTDRVHDGLEVTLILGSLDEHSGTTDEGVLGGSDDDGIGLATLATGSVVDGVTHELVDGERFSGDGRLISGNKRVALVGNTLTFIFSVLLFRAGWVLFGVEHVLLAQLLVLGEILWYIVVADDTGIGRDGLTFFDDDDITGNKFTSKDTLLLTLTDTSGLHGNVTLERSDDIGGCLFLVPTDGGVEEKNTNNNTQIDPVTQTS